MVDSDMKVYNKCKFESNEAQIGGGIRNKGQYPSFLRYEYIPKY